MKRDGLTQLVPRRGVTHFEAMSNQDILATRYTRGKWNANRSSRPTSARAPIIDQEGREIPDEALREGVGRSQFDFTHATLNPFGNLTREQRLARFEMLARLLDIAFILPGTKIRYGVDGIVRLIPVVGDVLATAFSLWLVREARALGAPWHVTARMLANVAVDGVVGMVPLAGDAFDVLFRANMRNVRLLRRWLDRQPHSPFTRDDL